MKWKEDKAYQSKVFIHQEKDWQWRDKGGELSDQKDVGRCVDKTASGIGILKDEKKTDELRRENYEDNPSRRLSQQSGQCLGERSSVIPPRNCKSVLREVRYGGAVGQLTDKGGVLLPGGECLVGVPRIGRPVSCASRR